MDGGEGDAVAADVEVRHVGFGEVHGEAAAGGLAFEVAIEADCGGVVEVEVRGGGGDEEEEVEREDEKGRWEGARGCHSCRWGC